MVFSENDPRLAFRQLAKSIAEQEFSGETVAFLEAQFGLTIGGRGLFFLDNIYGEARGQGPETQCMMLRRFFRSVPQSVDLPGDWRLAKDNILPRVRELSYLNTFSGKLKTLGRQGIDESIVMAGETVLPDHLFLHLVYDNPNSMQNLTSRQLTDWRIQAAPLYAVAKENLRRLSTRPAFTRVRDGLYVSRFRDNYDSSRLILPELFAGLELQGQPVALPFSRDRVFVTGSRDSVGLEKITDYVIASLDQTRFESLTPLILGERGWQVFAIGKHSELYQAFHSMNNYQQAAYYRTQKAMLDRQLAQTNDATQVVKFTLLTREDCAYLSSLTLWPKAPALIPAADMIVVESGDERLLLEWEDVKDLLSPYMQSTPYYPVRYRVGELPPATLMQTLRPLTRRS